LIYDEYKLAKHTEFLLYPHTILFNIWVELGLAGVFVFLLLFVRFFTAVLAGLRSTGQRELQVGLLAAMVTLLGHGLVDVPYFKNDLAVLFWLLLALAFLQLRMASAPGRSA
jgi:O-antigen ligase